MQEVSDVPLERLVSELTEAIILGVVERPVRYGGGGVTLYIRALNAALVSPSNPNRLYWQVSANITVLGEVKTWRAEGYDLNEAIAKTIGLIPQGLLYPNLYSKPKRKRRIVRNEKPSEESRPRRIVRRQSKQQPKKRIVSKRV